MTKQFEQLSDRGMYNCYSLRVLAYLKKNGFFYIDKGVNPSTNRTYYRFEITDELDEALQQFTANKKKYMESRELH